MSAWWIVLFPAVIVLLFALGYVLRKRGHDLGDHVIRGD